MTRARRFSDYPINRDVPGSGVHILSVLVSGPTRAKTLYRVLWRCCQAEVILNHKEIASRARTQHSPVFCSTCAATNRLKRKFEHYETGKVVPLTGIEILSVCNKHHTQEHTQYRARFVCCDTAIIISHRQLVLRARRDRKTTLCPACARAARTTRFTAMRAKQIATRATNHANGGLGDYKSGVLDTYHITKQPDWPAPSWVTEGSR